MAAAAYFVLSIHPSSYGFSHNDRRQVQMYRLTDSWTGLTGAYTNLTDPWPLPDKYDGKLEAPALFQHEGSGPGSYYLWASHCTYWFPNDAYVLQQPAPTLSHAGLWKPVGNPTHNDTSFGTQSTHILPIPQRFRGRGAAGRSSSSSSAGDPAAPTHIYVSDRFEPYVAQNLTGRYVWLPLTWQAGKANVAWHDEWQLHS